MKRQSKIERLGRTGLCALLLAGQGAIAARPGRASLLEHERLGGSLADNFSDEERAVIRRALGEGLPGIEGRDLAAEFLAAGPEFSSADRSGQQALLERWRARAGEYADRYLIGREREALSRGETFPTDAPSRLAYVARRFEPDFFRRRDSPMPPGPPSAPDEEYPYGDEMDVPIAPPRRREGGGAPPPPADRAPERVRAVGAEDFAADASDPGHIPDTPVPDTGPSGPANAPPELRPCPGCGALLPADHPAFSPPASAAGPPRGEGLVVSAPPPPGADARDAVGAEEGEPTDWGAVASSAMIGAVGFGLIGAVLGGPVGFAVGAAAGALVMGGLSWLGAFGGGA